ncbi:MAG: hypothetical protein GX896_04330, partial [Clostridiales bacterium]|nr:hypothetical protein [Clostridiales bacterium]
NTLSEKISKVEKQLEIEEANKPKTANYSDLVINIETLLKLYQQSDVKQQNELLKSIFREINLTKEPSHRYKPTEAQYNVEFIF